VKQTSFDRWKRRVVPQDMLHCSPNLLTVTPQTVGPLLTVTPQTVGPELQSRGGRLGRDLIVAGFTTTFMQ
jgi:hypothetical protein